MFEKFQREYYQILDIVPILLVISTINWGKKLASRTLVNIFLNNKQKHTNDLTRMEQIDDFDKGQRKKDYLFLS